MEKSRLNDLLAEPRNNIYEYALVLPVAIEIDDPERSVGAAMHPDLGDKLAFLSTCRQIRQEAPPTFLSGNEFIFHTGIAGNSNEELDEIVKARVCESLASWLETLDSCKKHIRSIKIATSVWHVWAEYGDYLCSFLPKALKDFERLFEQTQAKPMLSMVLHIEGEYGACVQLTVGLGDQARKAIEAAQREVDALLQDDDWSANSTEQMSRSKETLKSFLEHLGLS